MNKLSSEVSPYLLQHKNNPVHWEPWGQEALERAKNEDKPILVSIGYAACHWCHVMEHESFENNEVAAIMNKYFINIKVDREERPDVDMVYMEALHQMGLNGGWPLHVFLMPDQKPFYGGTYFNRANWMQILLSIQEAFENNRAELAKSADAVLANGQQTLFQRLSHHHHARTTTKWPIVYSAISSFREISQLPKLQLYSARFKRTAVDART